MAEGDATLGQIIGRHFDVDFVADKHADAVFAHFSGGPGDNFVVVLEFHPEHRVGQFLRHGARKLQQFFLRHITCYLLILGFAARRGVSAHYMAADLRLSSQSLR